MDMLVEELSTSDSPRSICVNLEVMPEAQLPGLCWACKWILNKVKKQISNGTDQETIKNKLISVCDQIGFLKSKCKSFVKKYLNTLIEELSTTDDPRTICVNLKACKPKTMEW
ncbi:antimicrobial peptide NK-lysin-like [Chanos chanos]|uniref:Antimicrobial peptide NK-lysin-like n=1 Tax=Chanos chanos TaxID=29144 RepID=A0A6J2WKR5_CHACN|nr:antimicrobial peptide NK-lysin-like [Chanos chanos]